MGSHLKSVYLIFVFLLVITSAGAQARNNKVTLTYIDWPPFHSSDLPENGFYSAICREIFKRMGYEIELVKLPWIRALEDVASGRFDAVLGAYDTKERRQNFLFSDAVAVSQEVFIKRKDSVIQYQGLSQLTRYSIVGHRHSAQVEALKALGFTVSEVEGSEHVALMVNAGRTDLGILGKHYLEYFIKQNNHPDIELEAFKKPFKVFTIHTLFSKKSARSQEMVIKFNRTLQALKDDGSYERILQRFDITSETLPQN